MRRLRVHPDPGGPRSSGPSGCTPHLRRCLPRNEESDSTSDTPCRDARAEACAPPGLESSLPRQRQRLLRARGAFPRRVPTPPTACAVSLDVSPPPMPELRRSGSASDALSPGCSEEHRARRPRFSSALHARAPIATRRSSTSAIDYDPQARIVGLRLPCSNHPPRLAAKSAYRYQVRPSSAPPREQRCIRGSAAEGSRVRGLFATGPFGAVAGTSRRDGSRRELHPNPIWLGHLLSPESSAARQESPYIDEQWAIRARE